MRALFVVLLLIVTSSATFANEPVAVVIGPNAPELEKYAASELCQYLDKLFGIKVDPTKSVSPSAREIFVIGSPATNPFIPKDDFAKVSDQGIVIKPGKLDN